MNNRLFLIIATAACLGSFTACSQDNDIVVPDGDLKAAISFNVNIGQIPDPQVTMRGASKDANTAGYVFRNGDKICVAIKGDGTTSARSTTEEKKLYRVETANSDAGSTGSPQDLVYDGTATDAFIWMSQSELIALRAWSDGTSGTTTADPVGATFTVSTTQNTDADIKELLYSPGPVSPATNYSYSANSSSLNIPLYHQLARIVVNIKVEKDSYSWANTDGVTIGHNSDDNRVPIVGTFTAPTTTNYGSWGVVDYSVNASHYGVITPKKETATTSGYDATYSAVVIPAPNTIYKSGMKLLNFSVNGETFFYKLPSATALTPGNQYTFNINVKNKSIEVVGCTITNWGTGTTGGTVNINKLQ